MLSPKALSITLQATHISNVVAHKRSLRGSNMILSLHESTTLAVVLTELATANILSVPIYKTSGDMASKVFTGIVSVTEILSYAFFQDIFEEASIEEEHENDSLNRFKLQTFFNSPIVRVLQARPEEPVPIVLTSSDSLYTLLTLFVSGHHRVLVLSSEIMIETSYGPVPVESSLTIISQLDIMQFLYDSSLDLTSFPSEFLLEVFMKRVDEVKEKHDTVIGLRDGQSTLDGFKLMLQNVLHALPILNEHGMIVGTLSAKDLRGLTIDNIASLKKPVAEFIQERHPMTFDTTNRSNTVQDSFSLILQDRKHHIWLVGQDKALVGCLTPTDLLALFL